MLTADDFVFLKEISNPSVLTLGRARVTQLREVVDRALQAVNTALQHRENSDFLANALWLSASGKLTEAQIMGQPRLFDEQKEDCLRLLQLRYDADAWREHCGFVLPPLPEAVHPDFATEPQ